MLPRRKKKREGPSSPLWMTTYGDMVTNLLAFFVLLYSFSEIDVQKFQAVLASFQEHAGVLQSGRTIQGQPPLEDAGLIRPGEVFDNPSNLIENILRDFVDQQGLSDSVTIVKSDEGVIVRFSDKLLFDLGKADLLPEAKQILTKLVTVMADWPNSIRVEGHTDNWPINTAVYPSNWELSVYRASTVVRFLEECRIDSHRLSAVGYGEYRPIATNKSEAGRRLNRRVDVIVITKELEQVLSPSHVIVQEEAVGEDAQTKQ